MDNAELVNILTETQRNSLAILLQAVNSCQADVSAGKPGAEKKLLKAMETLERFKTRFASDAAIPGVPAESLGKLPAVERYLAAAGWKIKKSKLYQDKKKGLLRLQPDGTVLKVDADTYAAAHLTPADAAPDADDSETLRLKRELVRAELEAKKQLVERNTLRMSRERGDLVSREEIDAMIVSAVSVLRSGMRQWIYVKMGELVELVGGDPAKMEEAIHLFLNESNAFFNGFARARTFEIVDDEEGLAAPAMEEAAS